MTCNHCKYLCYPEYESDYTACQVFGEEIPEEYERKDGEGCICNGRQLEKILRQNEEALEKDHEAYVKWFLERSRNESKYMWSATRSCEDCSRINKPNPYYDCISRQNAIDAMWEELDEDTAHKVRDIIELQPSVMPNQEFCEDCISRAELLKYQYRIDDSATLSTRDVVNVEDIEELPSIQPKTGHWVSKHIVDDCNGVVTWYECSECGRCVDETITEEFMVKDYPYCHCGAKMVESQESEG